MIYTDELEAALDQIDAVVIFHRVEQSTVQHLAQQLAEKAVAMVEQNEKTLDLKLGAGPGGDRGDARAGGEGARGRGERRGGGRGTLRGRGRGRGGFNSGLGGRRVAA
jgi:translation initiation factor 3 subunit C